MGRRLAVPILLGTGLLAALAAAATFSAARVSFRSAREDGQRVAQVLVGEAVVVELRSSAGGYTPLERAEIVANRLRGALDEGFETEDVKVSPVLSGHGLYIGDRLIVTVDRREADAHGATSEELGKEWRDNVLEAVGLTPPPEPAPAGGATGPEAPAGAAEAAPEAGAPAPAGAAAGGAEEAAPPAPVEAALDWTGSAQKWVPIFSLETEGAYIGAAQIAGARSQVDKVKGVAELRLNFRNLGRIYAYVPVSRISLRELNRVQGVSVWATGDLELASF
jgi:hypothetical protein